MIEIIRWDEYFEFSESRKRKHLEWFKFPNKLHGTGYNILAETDDGRQIYACWCALLQEAASQTVRGKIPHTISTISRHIGMPEDLVMKTVQTLSTTPFDWLSADDLPPICHESATHLPVISRPRVYIDKKKVRKENTTTCQNSALTDMSVLVYDYYKNTVQPEQANRKLSLDYIKRLLTKHGYSKEQLISAVDGYAAGFSDEQREQSRLRARTQNFFSPEQARYEQYIQKPVEKPKPRFTPEEKKQLEREQFGETT